VRPYDVVACGPSEAVARKTSCLEPGLLGAVPVQVTVAWTAPGPNGQVSQVGRPRLDSVAVFPAGASAFRSSVNGAPATTASELPSAGVGAANVGFS
jgi:hypothetical protein